ncbi:MAG: response regulator [Candidatus Omnitrophota bacterium]
MSLNKIIMIDDEQDLCCIVKERLQAKNFNVVTAFNGKEGLAQIKKHMPDLILLDLFMPEMDGYEVIKHLTKEKKTSDIPIIVLTAALTPDLEDKLQKVQAFDYLIKPFSSEQLMDKIQLAMVARKNIG